MNIVIFEDDNYDKFYPISLTRPVWEIRSGCFTQRDRIEGFVKDHLAKDRECNFYYFMRDYLAPLFKEKYPDLRINDYSFLDLDYNDTLFINSRVIPNVEIETIQKNFLIISRDGTPLLALIESARLHSRRKAKITELLLELNDMTKEVSGSFECLEYIWDLIKSNDKRISEDYNELKGGSERDIDKSIAFIGDKSRLYIEEGVRIDPFVCIDTSGGPVVIRKGSVINSFTKIEGPSYIGQNCNILGAKIRKGCSFGDSCRIGGEVEDTIFHGYSNKYHDGFIGHSYIGEWVNLGALTTNSDLKNNYTTVKVYIPERRLDTESIKVGCFLGDFVKTSIGTLISTGTSIGVGSMAVHSGRMIPYHIPSFAWYVDNRILDPGFFADFLESCEIMTSRRNVDFSERNKNLLTMLHEMTSDIRMKEISRWERMQK